MPESREFNILVAEDDAGYRLLLKSGFERTGAAARLSFVSDGLEAVRYLKGSGTFSDRRSFPFPDLVLLDINMPHLNGIGVLEWLRQQEWIGHVPVIILSNSEAQGDVDLAHELGANAFLLKPTGTSELEGLTSAIECFWIRLHRSPSCCGSLEVASGRRI
jgi:CheY-like chemotaxis protein